MGERGVRLGPPFSRNLLLFLFVPDYESDTEPPENVSTPPTLKRPCASQGLFVFPPWTFRAPRPRFYLLPATCYLLP